MLFHKTNRTIFLVYGDNNFIESRERIINEAKKLDLFTNYVIETDEIRHEPEFIDALKNPEFSRAFRVKKGGGCYIWKPYIIRKHLLKANWDDILVFADAGCTIQNKEDVKNEMKKCFKLVECEKGVLGRKNRHLESEYAKMDVFKYFGLENDSSIYNTLKYQCAVHMMRKCEHSVKMYEKWWRIAKTAADLFNNEVISKTKNYPNYIRHVWDTGTWSLICKTMGVVEVEDFPILVTRIRR